MIGSGELERAEKVLGIVYGGDLGRQLEALQVERASFDNVINHCWGIVEKHYKSSYDEMDPRLRAPINTMMGHLFLLGLVAGRNSVREIE